MYRDDSNENKRSKLCIRAVESLKEREKGEGRRGRNEEYLPWEPYILFLLTGKAATTPTSLSRAIKVVEDGVSH